jgi:hypothetical protein
MSEVDEREKKPDLEERLTTSPSHNLLIAAALAPKTVGRRLIMLHGEWDACAKPRRPLPHDVELLAGSIIEKRRPAYVISPERMDEHLQHMTSAWARAEAERHAQAWYTSERLRIVSCLKSLPAARDGLTEAAWLKGVDNARGKVLSVLAWWLDPVCPVCNGRRYKTMPGTARLSNRICPVDSGCGGTGERVLPHGLDGRLIEGLMIEFIYRARQRINSLDKGFSAVQWKRAGAL